MENLVNDDTNENPKQQGLSDSEVMKESGDEKLQDVALKPDSSEVKLSEDVKGRDDSMEELMGMYDESFKRFQEGEVVTGRIISIDKDYVLVDIGYKSEGQIRINEFREENGNITAKIDDTVEVMVEWWDDEEERVVLSKEKAEKVKVWDDIKKAHDDDGIVDGVILSRVKGGFSVDIGVQAFLPGS
ncbi:MAG: S1 RNA-binding domain-containing protein, partial [Proteobacteria bacterium]|nr:S1 RNA-binding domain-containing protein [Pseudomonadota bacterium]